MKGIQLAAAASVALMLSGCGSSDTAKETVTVSPSTVTVQNTPTAAAPAPAPAETAAPAPAPEASAEQWVMPDLIGRDLQAAQNEIQALTDYKVFFSGSTDLTGEGRMQINDRNWNVCTSTPPPGTAITASSDVSFGVVKQGESCP